MPRCASMIRGPRPPSSEHLYDIRILGLYLMMYTERTPWTQMLLLHTTGATSSGGLSRLLFLRSSVVEMPKFSNMDCIFYIFAKYRCSTRKMPDSLWRPMPVQEFQSSSIRWWCGSQSDEWMIQKIMNNNHGHYNEGFKTSTNTSPSPNKNSSTDDSGYDNNNNKESTAIWLAVKTTRTIDYCSRTWFFWRLQIKSFFVCSQIGKLSHKNVAWNEYF